MHDVRPVQPVNDGVVEALEDDTLTLVPVGLRECQRLGLATTAVEGAPPSPCTAMLTTTTVPSLGEAFSRTWYSAVCPLSDTRTSPSRTTRTPGASSSTMVSFTEGGVRSLKLGSPFEYVAWPMSQTRSPFTVLYSAFDTICTMWETW